MTLKKYHFVAFFIITVVMILDQLTKLSVVSRLVLGQSISITPFLNIVLVHNKGVSFGLLQSGQIWTKIFLICVALFLVSWLMFSLLKSQKGVEASAYGLVIGGALGNVLDRLIYGAVVDFLDFHLFHYHWPAFNMADSAIVFGVGIVFFQQIFRKNVI
jgi:signal peptidase II